MSITYLGVVPAIGFLVAMYEIYPLITENIHQMRMKRYQWNFRQKNIGMTHIPKRVAI